MIMHIRQYLKLFYCPRVVKKIQGMSCEGVCAHAHVRCAVAHVHVRAKSILESERDVRVCSPFLGMRCAIALLHTFAHFLGTKLSENATF